MRKICLIILLSFSFSQWFSLNHEGVSRTYYVSYPSNMEIEEDAPLIINMHGFGGNAAGTPFDFANGNFLNFILPVSIVSASVSGGASGIYLVEDIESGVFKRYQGMPISLSLIHI